MERALACRGSEEAAAAADTARARAKICASERSLPVTTATEGTPNMLLQMNGTALRCPIATTTLTPHLVVCRLNRYRAFAMADTHAGDRIGLYGFGAAAHIVAQVAIAQDRSVYAFTRAGDARSQQFAHELGATWAGDSATLPPAPLDAALLFAPVGALVPLALRAVRKGGVVVCAGIHMSDIPSFAYSLLWGERVVRSVANLTRADGEAFFSLTAQFPIRTHVRRSRLMRATMRSMRCVKGPGWSSRVAARAMSSLH